MLVWGDIHLVKRGPMPLQGAMAGDGVEKRFANSRVSEGIGAFVEPRCALL